uniref:Uncharacterized protein n=1 Tax=Clastoptera arizonana TaxID=38151 RepID=A0A1B6EDJ5_9HEMI
MGVTSIKDITVAACQNWKANVKSENDARAAWRQKWEWIQEEYKDLRNDLEELRQKRPKVQDVEKPKEKRTVRPFPETTSREVGWLSGRPEFLLDIYGPYPYTRGSAAPIEPPQWRN